MPDPFPRPPLRLPRPEISRLMLNLIVAAYLLMVLNGGFWQRASGVFAGDMLHLAGFGAVVAMLTLLTLALISLPLLHRPALALLIITAAVADHYQRSFGILIDREMIRNAMLTTATESKHLITAAFVLRLLAFGILPAALVFWPRLRPVRLWHWLWKWPLTVATCLALMLGFAMLDYKTYAAAVREHRDMMGAYQPGATIGAVTRYARQEMRSTPGVVQTLGGDAKAGPLLAAAPKPVLTVIFAGETARAQNFGLNGYARDTTPGLRGLDVVNFRDTGSCGTSTAVSLPCMFSPFGQQDYSYDRFRSSENLLDVLVHAGVKVIWADNNTGDQGIATRTGMQRIDATACPNGECTDAALLPVLEQTLRQMTEDTVLVLHMIGSHGPTYHLRYPAEFERFTPACRTADFARCTGQEISNAYDNTILFTDHVLTQAIGMMAAQDRVIPAMVYISDHGESLGEGGLYLHAAPMFMAPETQRKVPFVLWLSPPYQQAMGVDQACMARLEEAPVSHDNLFHSILGLMDITTTARDPALDLTAGCRVKGAT